MISIPLVENNFLRKCVIKAAIGICLALNVLEFLCFALIFAEMRVHHKRHVALCLANKPGAARRKKRRNVITAAGHFISWVRAAVD